MVRQDWTFLVASLHQAIAGCCRIGSSYTRWLSVEGWRGHDRARAVSRGIEFLRGKGSLTQVVRRRRVPAQWTVKDCRQTERRVLRPTLLEASHRAALGRPQLDPHHLPGSRRAAHNKETAPAICAVAVREGRPCRRQPLCGFLRGIVRVMTCSRFPRPRVDACAPRAAAGAV